MKEPSAPDITVAVDAMGGDRAPEVPVEGAVLAARRYGIPSILVGDEEAVRQQLERLRADRLPVSVRHAGEVVGMQESPLSAARSKPQSSIRVCFDCLIKGEARAVFSAGNTGATLASALISSKRLDGIARPAVAATLPCMEGDVVFIDAGASTSCRPGHLAQFALMGTVFAREIMGIQSPRVGLLSNGTEESKGTETLREAREIIKTIEGIEYVGFIEGGEIMQGGLDVVVTDGFTGNLVLKTIEGVGEFIVDSLADIFTGGALNRLGLALLRDRIRNFRTRIDYASYGGAPLVGIRHTCIIGHGRSSPEAVVNAERIAVKLETEGYLQKLADELDRTASTSLREVDS